MVRENLDGWGPEEREQAIHILGELPSPSELRTIGMLRRLHPESRQHVLDILRTAYFDEMEKNLVSKD